MRSKVWPNPSLSPSGTVLKFLWFKLIEDGAGAQWEERSSSVPKALGSSLSTARLPQVYTLGGGGRSVRNSWPALDIGDPHLINN